VLLEETSCRTNEAIHRRILAREVQAKPKARGRRERIVYRRRSETLGRVLMS